MAAEYRYCITNNDQLHLKPSDKSQDSVKDGNKTKNVSPMYCFIFLNIMSTYGKVGSLQW